LESEKVEAVSAVDVLEEVMNRWSRTRQHGVAAF
jgi:hypothetical protein